MPYNIYNLTEEDRGGEIITADAAPALTITNFSTAGRGLDLISGASVQLFVNGAVPASLTTSVPQVLIQSVATVGSALRVERATTNLAAPTIPLIQFNIQSTASTPVFQLLGQSFVSCTTIRFTTGAVAGVGGIRVLYPDGTTQGWIPVMPSGSVDAAAR